MIYIVDSWAWIEYFIGSSKGGMLKKLIGNKNNKFITMECTLSELKSYCLRTESNFDAIYNIVKRNSIVLPVLKENWLDAAEIRHNTRKKTKDFGLVDALLISKQREHSCMIISGDNHFKEIKGTVYIGN